MRPVHCRLFHTSQHRNGLEEFFDLPENWGESAVKSGTHVALTVCGWPGVVSAGPDCGCRAGITFLTNLIDIEEFNKHKHINTMFVILNTVGFVCPGVCAVC